MERPGRTVRVRLVGDVMLGRGVGDALAHEPGFEIWGDTLPVLLASDVLIGNLECAITDRGRPWPGKTFHFRVPRHLAERALRALVADGPILHLNIANNHVLDFGGAGLDDTLAALDALGIAHAGAGVDAPAARRPAVFEAGGLRFHVFGAADYPREWAAGVPLPRLKGVEGIWWFDLSAPDALVAAVGRYRAECATADTDVLIVCLHIGPNWEPEVSAEKMRLGRRLVREAGVRLVCMTSAHHLQPYEIVDDSVIFYSLGDFVDDYAVDPAYRNDLGIIANVDFAPDGRLVDVGAVSTRISGNSVHLAEESGTDSDAWL